MTTTMATAAASARQLLSQVLGLVVGWYRRRAERWGGRHRLLGFHVLHPFHSCW
ncbi:hypothetical protein ACFQY5_33235 [Paeniroseomonas aquatica]|uniref:hypothetical protein n=1 Tax=Paeniroseomonas aquatica TaxID=373043 RepID=UPI00361F7A85